MEVMTRFYRQFGWPEAPSSEPVHVVFQCANGVVLGLYAAKNYETHHGPVTDTFRGFTLGINCAGMDEVQQVYEAVRTFEGVEDLDPPMRTSWGGGFGFRDPEGNIWDIAWADGSRFDDRGGLTFP
jgi:uncharacterized protein